MKQITFKNKFGYFLGDFANCMTFAMSSGFLLKFYTDVAGITAAAAGTLFLVARIWDAVNDPLMGGLTDKMFAARMKKHKGRTVDKFKPFLLTGSWLVVAAAILMFFMPSGLSGWQRLLWAYIIYILWGMCYTFVNIPYGSLAAVMTKDPGERASLSVARGIGGTVGNILPRILVPMVLTYFGTDQAAKGYLSAMVLMGILGLVGYVITYFTVQENIRDESLHTAEKGGGSYLRVLGKNKPFISVCLASLGMLLGNMTSMAMMVYYFEENLNNLAAMGIASVLGLIPALLIAPFLSRLVKRYSLKKVVSISSLLSAAAFGVVLVLPSTVGIYIVGTLIANVFLNVPMTLIWGMVSECIDYNQQMNGQRQEGIIYGSYSFIRKIGQALAGFISGVGLSVIGYQAGAAQSTGTLFGIKFLTLGFPALGMVIAFISFLFLWNIDTGLPKEKTVKIDDKIS